MYTLKFFPNDNLISDKTSYCYDEVTEDFLSGYLASYLAVTEFDTDLVEVTEGGNPIDTDNLETIILKYDQGEEIELQAPYKIWNDEESTKMRIISDESIDYGHTFHNVTTEFRKGLGRFMTDLGTANHYKVLVS